MELKIKWRKWKERTKERIEDKWIGGAPHKTNLILNKNFLIVESVDLWFMIFLVFFSGVVSGLFWKNNEDYDDVDECDDEKSGKKMKKMRIN